MYSIAANDPQNTKESKSIKSDKKKAQSVNNDHEMITFRMNDCIWRHDSAAWFYKTLKWLMKLHERPDNRVWMMKKATKKRLLHRLRRWTSTVTDLRKNSRYPGLARTVFFPILLLIVCKKKQTTNYFTVCFSQYLLEFFLHSIWS